MKNLPAPLRVGLATYLLLAAVLPACGKAARDGTDSSTHWLARCQTDQDCGDLQCLCGECTRTCSEASGCPDPALARCEPVAAARCELAAPICRVACSADRECAAVRAGLACVSGYCEPEAEADSGVGGSGGSGGAGAEAGSASGGSGSGDDCDAIPQCAFACPEGTVNPVDENGCEHSCECVQPGTAPGSLRLFMTCGDPVCSGHTPRADVALCSTEQVGEVCRIEGARCDPEDDCNSLVVCASSDPREAPGGCPISRLSYKQDVHYLAPEELARYQAELLELELATWRYKHDPAKLRLGFILDDHETSVAADPARDQVDLYGYTSLAVAALQAQARQIAALERELATLRARVDAAPAASAPPPASSAPQCGPDAPERSDWR